LGHGFTDDKTDKLVGKFVLEDMLAKWVKKVDGIKISGTQFLETYLKRITPR
jgi:hypothetical protein